MRDQKYDALIIGAGVIGLACAHYLTDAGRKVAVIEKQTIGSGASHGNCGIVFTSDLMPLCAPGVVREEIFRKIRGTSALYIKPGMNPGLLIWLLKFAGKCNKEHLNHAVSAREKLLRQSRLLYDQLLSEDNLACEWEQRGILMVYKNERTMAKYALINAVLEPYGLDATPVVGQELHSLEPSLKTDVYGAWHHTFDTHLRPETLMKSWTAVLRNKGVDLIEHCEAKHFDEYRGNIVSVLTSKGTYRFGNCILAAGAWSPLLAKAVSLKLPIQPGKGYSITTNRPLPCPNIPCYFYERSVVATPFSNGYRLGSTMEFSGYNMKLNPGRIRYLKQAAAEYLQAPAGNTVEEEWTSLRPMTYDDLPIIGPVPNRKNLFLATGHGMTGISMGPGTGKLIAELVTGRSPHIDPTPYGIARF